MKKFIHHDLPELERITNVDGKRVYKTPSGQLYPSVTSVTGFLAKKEIMEWRNRVGEEEANRVSARATGRGTRIHSLCEQYLLGKSPKADIFEYEMFESMKCRLDEIDNIHCLETPLYSDFLRVAGTVDCIAEFRGKLSVIDFKTASSSKDRNDIHNYFMQCAAYSVAFEERTKIPVGRLVIFMGSDDAVHPRLFIEKRDDWIEKFRELRLEYKNQFGV